MNKDKIKKILDKTDIYVLDEINILEYIDELEKVKEDYIKSLDKLDVLEEKLDISKDLIFEIQYFYKRNYFPEADERYDRLVEIIENGIDKLSERGKK